MEMVSCMQEEDKNSRFDKNKVLLRSMFLENKPYKLVIFMQVFIFPFFAYWFYFHNFKNLLFLNGIFDFLNASVAPAASVVIINWNDKLFNVRTRKPLKWYDPRLSLIAIPAIFGHGQYNNILFWKNWLYCDLFWCLLISPLWAIYFYSKRIAQNTRKELSVTEDKKRTS